MLKVRGGPFADDSNDPRSSYRGHPSFEELMVQQGTGPITDVSALHGHCWPEEENVEDFIAAYREWRGHKRAEPALRVDKDMPTSPVANRLLLVIEYHREEDERWLADIPALPGVTAYGQTKEQATVAIQALALRLIADRLEHGEVASGPLDVTFVIP